MSRASKRTPVLTEPNPLSEERMKKLPVSIRKAIWDLESKTRSLERTLRSMNVPDSRIEAHRSWDGPSIGLADDLKIKFTVDGPLQRKGENYIEVYIGEDKRSIILSGGECLSILPLVGNQVAVMLREPISLNHVRRG